MISSTDDLEIIVIGNKRKTILTTEFLKGVDHRVFYTNDYPIPKYAITDDWIPERAKLGAYRCFRGHQDALKSAKKDNVLVFEDDAVAIDDSWQDVVHNSLSLLDKFDVVNLHFRLFRERAYEEFHYNGLEFLCPKKDTLLDVGRNADKDCDKFYGVAALAYIINKKSFDKLFSYSFNGVPFDILLWKEFSFCFIKRSPFKHDRRMGSLVENRLNIR